MRPWVWILAPSPTQKKIERNSSPLEFKTIYPNSLQSSYTSLRFEILSLCIWALTQSEKYLFSLFLFCLFVLALFVSKLVIFSQSIYWIAPCFLAGIKNAPYGTLFLKSSPTEQCVRRRAMQPADGFFLWKGTGTWQGWGCLTHFRKVMFIWRGTWFI